MILMLSWVTLMSLVLGGVLLGLGLVLSMSGELNQDKLTPFECGFNPNLNYRSMFSLQFFVVSLIFLIFDLEPVILFPYLLSNKLMMSLEAYLGCSMFILLLSGGLIYEWMSKNLEWCS
uniref:NADH-ubiquinone oxidoreductase chain 3 n=1 Tax=Caligus rogercresseyi TaxID=217165 RepID=E1B2P7_CALRO|nr:NADH dehydrogenase subunit 3 [Caligus rogercresseyi]